MKVLVADDHELFLVGLHFMLQNYCKDFELICAHDYREIFTILETQKDIALILTDLAMPGAYWKEALEKIHKTLPNTPIIILSAVFENKIVQNSIDLGVAGYIPKTASNTEIQQAIELVLSGGVFIPTELLEKEKTIYLDILRQPEQDVKKSQDLVSLSPRQHDVLQLIAQGKANKQIAFELGITEGTVKLYVTALFKVLDVYNRTSAVLKAKELGILDD